MVLGDGIVVRVREEGKEKESWLRWMGGAGLRIEEGVLFELFFASSSPL